VTILFSVARRLPLSKPSKSEAYDSPVKWWFMLLLSTFMAIAFSCMVPESLRAREVVKQGKYVTVEVLKIRTSSFGRNPSHYLYFDYQGYNGNVRLGYKFLSEIQGKKEVRLLHLEKFPTLFVPPIMPPDYNDTSQFYSLIILVCFMIFMVPYCAVKIYRLSGK
jgi:hypothetical protein